MLGLSGGKSKRELTPRWKFALGDYPTSIAVSAKGDRLLVGTGAGDLVVIDTAAGAETRRLRAHPGGVLSVSYGANAVASAGQDGKARVYSESGELLHELPGNDAWVEHVAWSPDGKRLATASGKHVRIWNGDGTPFLETQAHACTVTALQWSRRGSELATTCYGGAYVWKVETGKSPRHLPFRGSLVSLAWSPDETVVACGSQDCSVHFWRLKTGTDSEMTGYPFKPKALAWDASSSMLATGGDAAISVWDFAGKGPEGTRPITLDAHKAQVTSLAFHPRKGLLASLAQDMGIIVWQPRKGAEPHAFAWLDDTPEALVWHPQEPGLITADVAGGLTSWSLPAT
jgi:WD40 repeat protein